MNQFPDYIKNVEQLENLLSLPDDALKSFMKQIDGDLLILGVGGKMGTSLALLAKRACEEAGVKKRIIGVSRFTNSECKKKLEMNNVETITCDLLNYSKVQCLPQIKNVIFMAGRKFETSGKEEETWASNVIIPLNTAQNFKSSRIIVFSTGCVYPLVSSETGGCTEETAPSPLGEYAQSCLGRERIFQYYSKKHGTEICIIRLNYAIDMRYGVLHDIARNILSDKPVDISVPNVNIIWQGDANKQALLSLQLCESPAEIINIAGPETASIKNIAVNMGKILQKPVVFINGDLNAGYLNNSSKSAEYFGYPRVSLKRLIHWTANWIKAGGVTLDKPTKYEINTGVF